MIVRYWVNCFDRELCIDFPDEYKHLQSEIENILDNAYDEWNSTEDIEDEEERRIVECSCCEEHMMFRLSKIHNTWTAWWSEGDEDEEGIVIKNENVEHYTQTYITLDAEELSLLGINPEYWNDCEVINDAIHSMIYGRKNK